MQWVAQEPHGGDVLTRLKEESEPAWVMDSTEILARTMVSHVYRLFCILSKKKASWAC